MSIAPYARFSYLKKKEAVIELLPVRQNDVCGILPAFSCPAAVKIGGTGAATQQVRGAARPREGSRLWVEDGHSHSFLSVGTIDRTAGAKE